MDEIIDYSSLVKSAHEKEVFVAVAADLLSSIDSDSSGRMGMLILYLEVLNVSEFQWVTAVLTPAFFASKNEFKRTMPGRIIGIYKRCKRYIVLCVWHCKPANNISNEKKQHQTFVHHRHYWLIWPDFYAVYHGPEGIRQIANRIHCIACFTRKRNYAALGYTQLNQLLFRYHSFCSTSSRKT